MEGKIKMFVDIRKFERHFTYYELKTICTLDPISFQKNPRDLFVFRQKFGKIYSKEIFGKNYNELTNDEKIALCYVPFHRDYYTQFMLESKFRPFNKKSFDYLLEKTQNAEKIFQTIVKPYVEKLEKKILKSTGSSPNEDNPIYSNRFQRKKKKMNTLFKPFFYIRYEKLKSLFKNILFKRNFSLFEEKMKNKLKLWESLTEEEIQIEVKELEENNLFDFYRDEINKKLQLLKEKKKKVMHAELTKEKEELAWKEFLGVEEECINESMFSIKEKEEKIKEINEIPTPKDFDFSKIELWMKKGKKDSKPTNVAIKKTEEKECIFLITPKEYGFKETSFVNLIIKKTMSRVKIEEFEFYKYAKSRGIYNLMHLKMEEIKTITGDLFLKYDKDKNDFYLEENLEEKPRELLRELESIFDADARIGYRNTLIFCNFFLNNQSGKNVNKYKTFCKLIICDIFNEVMKRHNRFLEYRISLKSYVPRLLEIINQFKITMVENIK